MSGMSGLGAPQAPFAIGLDLGTSGVKAVLLSADGQLLAEATAPLAVSRPQPLWSEQDPADWLAAVHSAMAALREQADPAQWQQVRALAAAGQMHGAVLLDAQGRVLRPAILWNDGRCQAECDELEAREPATRRITANRAMAGFTAPKLMWVARHEPAVFAQVVKVLLPKDWLVLQFTGQYSSEMSDAAGTLWLDVAKRQWSLPMLAASGMRLDQMPALHEGPDAVGALLPRCCQAWGLPAQVQVAAGAGDNAGGAVGVGVVRPGDALLSLGTSGVIFVATAGPQANPERGVHTFCHAWPDTWHQMAVMLSASSALSWWCGITGAEPAALLASLAVGGVRAAAPIFLPYLSGERTPHADPGATGSFHGLTHAHGRDDLSYAVLEGVAFAFADGLAALQERPQTALPPAPEGAAPSGQATLAQERPQADDKRRPPPEGDESSGQATFAHEAGSRPARLLAIGGGARSDVWLQLLADVLNVPIARPAGAEVGPALGAARLALLSLGLDRATVVTPPPIAQSFEPTPANRAALQARLARYRAAHAPLRALS